VTERLGFLLAHRPGFVAPPVAARKLATLDQLSGGVSRCTSCGGSDAIQAKDGDWTDHEARYRRAAEYVSLLRRTWTSRAVRHGGRSSTGPRDLFGNPLPAAAAYPDLRWWRLRRGDPGARPHVDVFMLWGER